MLKIKSLTESLSELNIAFTESDFNKCGYNLEVQLAHDQVRTFAKEMLKQEFYLDLVTAVHVSPDSQIVYQFASFDEPCRVNAKAITQSNSIPTISDIFHGADWHERETHDFYGISFDGHSDLRVLILDESDADLKPLLKSDKKLKPREDITWSSETTEKKSTSEKTKPEKTKPVKTKPVKTKKDKTASE